MQISMRDGQYVEMLAGYHFGPDDLTRLRQVGALVEKAAAPVLYWDRMPGTEEQAEEIAAIVTLGAGVDELQDGYMSEERLSESYMAECVGMELLRAAYEQTAERIYASTGKWLSGFAFLGERAPLERMEEIFRRLAPEGVSYNQAYMLTPRKTVAFLTSLRGERRESYCNICADCTNFSCRNRPEDGRNNLTYGYRRIFGEKEREV